MPVYTCTTTQSTLTSDVKAALAAEVGRIHSEINHVPSIYVNVVFNELPADAVYTDGRPAAPVLMNGWVIAHAITRIADVPAERVLVVFQTSPARFAVEAGRVLPEPGQEQMWISHS
jgi:phenylpyruvate tautomerase PptA (4-oxalocrotonate tautomerase family)